MRIFKGPLASAFRKMRYNTLYIHREIIANSNINIFIFVRLLIIRSLLLFAINILVVLIIRGSTLDVCTTHLKVDYLELLNIYLSYPVSILLLPRLILFTIKPHPPLIIMRFFFLLILINRASYIIKGSFEVFIDTISKTIIISRELGYIFRGANII
jgi:hypothetical protein